MNIANIQTPLWESDYSKGAIERDSKTMEIAEARRELIARVIDRTDPRIPSEDEFQSLLQKAICYQDFDGKIIYYSLGRSPLILVLGRKAITLPELTGLFSETMINK